MTYHLPYTQIGQFMGRETVYCNLNSNMVEGAGCPVLAVRQRHGPWNSLPMLRLSEVLQSWWDRNVNESRLRYRLARASKKYTRCQPPYPGKMSASRFLLPIVYP